MQQSRRHAPPAERRAQILAAALDCFSRKGYHAATMDDLVRASGLSKGSLYWHFESKQDVFLAIFDAFVQEAFDAFERIAAGPEPALDKLRLYAETMLEHVALEGGMLGVWVEFFAQPHARERFAAAYRRSRRVLGDLLADAVARGEVRDLPVAGMAAALTAAIEGLLLQAMVDESFDVREHWPTLWESLSRGIQA